MAPTLTVHQGDAQAEYIEHPIETARRALREAARLELASGADTGMEWFGLLTRFAGTLPKRDPIKREEGASRSTRFNGTRNN